MKTLKTVVAFVLVLFVTFGSVACGDDSSPTAPSTTSLVTTPTTPGSNSNDSITFGCDASAPDDRCYFFFLDGDPIFEGSGYDTPGLELNPGERRRFSEGSETNYGAVIRTGDRYIVVVHTSRPWISPHWSDCSSNGGHSPFGGRLVDYYMWCKRAYIKHGYNN